MINFNSKVIVLSLSLFLSVVSCRKNENFSDTPKLEWRSHEIVDDPSTNRREILLTVYFTDGDGDIGRDNTNNLDPCNVNSYDLRIKYFEQVSGSLVEITPNDTCLFFHNIIPNLTPEGQNKTLEGDLITTFSYLAYPENANVDSVRFDFQLFDRNGNVSNMLSSPMIFIPEL